jgi:putative tricarboxylic transport membrane protein
VNSKDRQADLSTSLVALMLASIAAVAVWQAQTFSTFGSIFPIVIGVTLFFTSLGVFVRALKYGATVKEQRSASGMRNSLTLIAILIAWAATLEWIGFLVTSWFAFVALALLADGNKPTLRRTVIYCVVGCVVIGGVYLLFQHLLKVRLP